MTDAQAKAKWMAIERPLCVGSFECWCLVHHKGTVLVNGQVVPAMFTKCALRVLEPVVLEKRFPTCKVCSKIMNNDEVTGNDMLRRALGIT